MSKASNQITEYLSVGGLFNPEIMNQTQHEAVRDTLIKARDDIQQLERENVALREKARLLEETCYGLSAPHYILDPDLRASKFREALRSYSAITIKTGVTIGAAQPEAQP